MTDETEIVKKQILSTGNAEILLEENDFLIVKWTLSEIKYSMVAYQYGKTGMANNFPWSVWLYDSWFKLIVKYSWKRNIEKYVIPIFRIV